MKKLAGAALAAALAFSPFGALVHAQDQAAQDQVQEAHVVSTGTRFTKLTVESVGGFVMISHWKFVLEPNGSYSYQRFNETPVTGKATAQELAKVKAAWNAAKLEQGAHQVPGIMPDVPTKIFTYDYMTMGGVPIALSGSYSGMAQFPANVEEVLNALYAIRNRVENALNTLTFTEIDYSVTNPWGMYNSSIKITNDGKIHYVRPHNTGTVDDLLTLVERQKLNAAFKKAKVATLPANVNDRIVPDGSTFDLKSEVGGKSYESRGFFAELTNKAKRVQPLLDELNAIQQRLDAKPTPTPAATPTPGASGVLGTSHP
jgi:hypothetical protein